MTKLTDSPGSSSDPDSTYTDEPGVLTPFPRDPDKPARPEEQHFPFLGLKINWSGLEVTTDDQGRVLVAVTNNGNAVAPTPVVEILQSPYNSIAAVEVSVPDESLYERVGYAVLPSLQPRQSFAGFLDCRPTASNTLLIVMCYEPLLDPKPNPDVAAASAPEFRRKVDSGWWSKPN